MSNWSIASGYQAKLSRAANSGPMTWNALSHPQWPEATRDMNLRTVTWRGGPPGRQALLESERPPAFATIPMTRAMLADFDFYTIEFTHRGERTLGFLSHDPERNQFAIVY